MPREKRCVKVLAVYLDREAYSLLMDYVLEESRRRGTVVRMGAAIVEVLKEHLGKCRRGGGWGGSTTSTRAQQ